MKSYLQIVHSDYKQKQNALEENKDNNISNDIPLFIVSDSELLSNEWNKQFKKGERLIKNLIENFHGKSGSHKLNLDELNKKNLKKIDINYETILDFHIMLNARIIGNDGTSRFSKMANEIGKFESSFFKF